TQAAAASFCWLELPAGTTPPFMIGLSAARLLAGGFARPPLSLGTGRRPPFFFGPRPRPDSAGARPGALGAGGPLVTLDRERVRIGAGDLAFLGDVLGGLDHAGDDAEALDGL